MSTVDEMHAVTDEISTPDVQLDLIVRYSEKEERVSEVSEG